MAEKEQAPTVESVERVRDIIFGPKMRDYEQRFEALGRDIARLQAELDRLNELLTTRDTAQSRNLQALRQELRQADDELRAALKAETGRLAAQLAEQDVARTTGEKNLRQELQQGDSALQAAFKAEIARLEAGLADHAAAQEAALQNLRQELRKADADLREELRLIAQRLTEDKTDRATLGDLFIELGHHVKAGGSLADLLQGLEQPG
ncbi:MAG: hypothetical protein N2439_09280 [Anaerolineae bacterium]|nr:hypothetical protein [Anaerolineae bacterium]